MANIVEHTLNDALGSLLRAKNGNWAIVTQATQVLQDTRKVPDILITAGASSKQLIYSELIAQGTHVRKKMKEVTVV